MRIEFFNKVYAGYPNIQFIINKDEFLLCFNNFWLFYHSKDNNTFKKPHFALIIGAKGNYDKCFLRINRAYKSTKHFLGLPVQCFLWKDYTEINNNNECNDTESN